MMDADANATGLVDAAGRPVRRDALPGGGCPECGAAADRFKGVFGGFEVCMQCGHEREQRPEGGHA